MFEELPYHDNQRQPIIGAPVSVLPPGAWGPSRLAEMLAMSIADCARTSDRLLTPGIPVIIGLAELDRPGGDGKFGATIMRLVEERLGIRFDPQRSRTIASGHTSCFEGLLFAKGLLKDSDVDACLVCGVDSYLSARTLCWLDQNSRLKTPLNSDGVIPGEAAGAIIVERRPSGGTPVKVAGLGFGRELAPVLSSDPLLGVGLTEAARNALNEASVELQDINFRLSDVTGESYGFREHALFVARLLRVHREEEHPIWHPADSTGDTGAAAGLLQLVTAFHAFRKGYAPGRLALCATSGLSGSRAVAVLDHQVARTAA